MKTITEVYTVYNFNELSTEAKEKAIYDYYEHEEYPFLSEYLQEELKNLLQIHNIKENGDTKLYYSLSYCQGDGACFIGSFIWQGYDVSIVHASRYYHEKATGFTISDNNDDNAHLSIYTEFKNRYYDICKKIEKYGYNEIEYRMTYEVFNEHCESNEYTFLKDGTMKNE